MECDCKIGGETGRHIIVLCQGHRELVERHVATEREACAKIAEDEAERRHANSKAAKGGSHEWGFPADAGMAQGHKAITASDIALKIRARNNS